MFNPPQWWNSVGLAWKVAATILAAAGLIVARWKNMLTLYGWCLEKHDAPVVEAIESERAICTTEFICHKIRRSEKSVHRSLGRLEKAGKVCAFGIGFLTRRGYDSIDPNRPWR